MPFLIYRIVSKVLKAVLSIDFSAPVIYSDIFPIISPINSANVAEDITLEQTLDFDYVNLLHRNINSQYHFNKNTSVQIFILICSEVLFFKKMNYFIIEVPVISAGCSSPITLSIVGAISASTPFSRSSQS